MSLIGGRDEWGSAMPRKEGSGLSRPTTQAVEGLVAESFVPKGDRGGLVSRLDSECLKGLCGVSGGQIAEWTEAVVDQLGLGAVAAETPAPDGLGDVRLTLPTSDYVWVEVKAQTTKSFRDLTQADYVRNDTDAVRWLNAYDPEFSERLSPWTRSQLEVVDPDTYFGDWKFEDLWLADLGLLHDRLKRAEAGVASPRDLVGFFERKYLFHYAKEGLRAVRLDQLSPIARMLEGEPVVRELRRTKTTDATLWVKAGGEPRQGITDFIYYVGYTKTQVLGRHKLTHHAVDSSDGVLRSP